MNTRRAFLAASSAALVTPSVVSAALRRIDGGPDGEGSDQIQATVAAAHGDFDTLRTLVGQRPELAKANWDWGFGDWESALGAASHMARPDIAEYLIANGARPTVFTYAMLGQVDVVRAVCTANPGIQRTLGPHGTFTLMRHAQMAKQTLVVEYLAELGDADIPQPDLGLAEADAKPYLGDYRPTLSDATFHIAYDTRRSVLTFRRDERAKRFLFKQGDHAFAPNGAPSVRIEFAVADGGATALTIVDGPFRTAATILGC